MRQLSWVVRMVLGAALALASIPFALVARIFMWGAESLIFTAMWIVGPEEPAQ